ncbi:MAG: hypothetical protein R3F11_14155 [Verrucomicrobiales bacterium]
MPAKPRFRIVPRWALVGFLLLEAILGAAWWRSQSFSDSCNFWLNQSSFFYIGQRHGFLEFSFVSEKVGPTSAPSWIMPPNRFASERIVGSEAMETPEFYPVEFIDQSSAVAKVWTLLIAHYVLMLLLAIAFTLFAAINHHRLLKAKAAFAQSRSDCD